MAFQSSNLFLSRGAYNSTSYDDAPSYNTYISTDDTISTIATPGYFPDFFGQDPLNSRVHDIFSLMGSDNNVFAIVSSLEPVVFTAFFDFPSNLVTELITTQSNEYSGIWAANIPILIDFVQQGHECLMTVPSGFDVSTGGPFISFTSPVIAGSIPLYDVIVPFEIMDNSISEIGHLELKTDGSVKVFRLDATAFSIGGTAGFPTQSVKYRTT